MRIRKNNNLEKRKKKCRNVTAEVQVKCIDISPHTCPPGWGREGCLMGPLHVRAQSCLTSSPLPSLTAGELLSSHLLSFSLLSPPLLSCPVLPSPPIPADSKVSASAPNC